MAWFSPLKGGYPGLQQIDKTLSVSPEQTVAATRIVRGSLVYVNAENEFELANAAQSTDETAYLFFALVGQDDFQAGMAGSIGQGPDGGVARITALACSMPLEFQTDQFGDGQFTIGTYLTCGDGGLLVPHANGGNVVAQVTATPFERWCNGAEAVAGRRTGGLVTVINARAMWIPQLISGS